MVIKREIVPVGEEGERLRDAVDQLDRLRQDALAEGHDRAQVVLGDLALGQMLVTEAQVAAESSRTVAMNSEVRPLDLVEDGPRLFSRQRRMGQEIEEILDRPLEVDVVLPEGVVGVEDEILDLFSRLVPHVAFSGITRRSFLEIHEGPDRGVTHDLTGGCPTPMKPQDARYVGVRLSCRSLPSEPDVT